MYWQGNMVSTLFNTNRTLFISIFYFLSLLHKLNFGSAIYIVIIRVTSCFVIVLGFFYPSTYRIKQWTKRLFYYMNLSPFQCFFLTFNVIKMLQVLTIFEPGINIYCHSKVQKMASVYLLFCV